MDNNENFDQYSLDELKQMLKNLDRQRFPEDVHNIESEIAKRTGEPLPEPLESNTESSDAEGIVTDTPPEPELVFNVQEPVRQEAQRLQRLFASIIDTFIQIITVVPLFLFIGAERFEAAQNEFDLGLVVVSFIYGIVAIIVVQGYFLHHYAQTIGKRFLNIRIENLDGTKATFSRVLYWRYIPISLVAQIPGLGPLIGLVDALFIFRSDRRCLHDHIAGTRVMQCPPEEQESE